MGQLASKQVADGDAVPEEGGAVEERVDAEPHVPTIGGRTESASPGEVRVNKALSGVGR